MARRSIIAGAALCLASITVAAQAAGPYVGVLGGSFETRQRVPLQTFAPNEAGEMVLVESEIMTVTDDRRAYGALLGWQLNRNLALETGYLHAKTSRDTFTDATTWVTRASAWTVTALYTLPLSSRWSAHARLGGVRRNNELAVGFQGSAPIKFGGHEDGLLYGAGVGMKIQKLHVRFDLQSAKMHSRRTSVMSLGANWYF